MFPQAPPFKGALRLARLSDIPRIGVVAAASFYHSSWFHYERPYFEKNPYDTLSSYRSSFGTAVLDSDSVVLVVEDNLNTAQASNVYEALAGVYPAFDEQIPKEMLEKGKAVVAVASFYLLPNSKRSGQFQPEDDPPPTDYHVSSRDKHPLGGKTVDEVLRLEEVKAFMDRMVIDMMVTHPAYWRKGHATTITGWFLELAMLDGIGLGVAGAPMGKVFFSHKGFKEAKTVEIPGYEAHPSPIYAWLGLFDVEKDQA